MELGYATLIKPLSVGGGGRERIGGKRGGSSRKRVCDKKVELGGEVNEDGR